MKRTSKKNIQAPIVPNKKQKPESKPTKTSFGQKNFKYLFLVLSFFYIVLHLYSSGFQKEILTNLQKILFIPTILIGIIAVYFDKNKLSKTINKLFKPKTDKQTYKSFFEKNELLTSSLFIIILVISAFTLFYKLGNFDFFSDEVQVTKGAAGYYHTGEYRQWDFIKEKTVGKAYNRAKPHQWIVAQSYKLFGINEWASRFPSALFEFIFIFLLYFIGRFFVKDKNAALLTALSFSLYFEFLFLGRWARMYAMMYPIFILAFYWTFKFITEKNNYALFNSGKHPVLEKYFSFNYIYLPFLLVLVYIGFNTHTNIAVLFPIFYIFLFLGIFLFPNEKKYLSAFLIASVILILQIIFPYKVNFSQFTAFKVHNSEIYNKALFGYPFNVKINFIFLVVGFSTLFFVRNISFRKKYSILFITAFVIWVFFSFVIEYAPSYRYVSFITPLTVLLIIGTFILINKALFNKTIQIILISLLPVSLFLHFNNHYNDLYVRNSYSPAKPSVSQKVIVENFRKGDILIKHWGPDYYLQEIDTTTKTFSLGTYKGIPLNNILKTLQNNPSGWLYWHKHFEKHLDPPVVNYANIYFKKYAGYGIDNYGEEIYYYNKKMLQSLKHFAFQQYLPAANLSLKNPYSFVFDLNINEKTDNSIFYLKNDSIIDIDCYIKNKNLIFKTSGKDSIFIPLTENQNNRVFWIFNKEKSEIYLNGEKITEKELKLKPVLVKFIIKPQFNGKINNIRIYNFNLDNAQIKAITEDKKISKELTANNKTFRTLFLWKQKK